MALMMANDGYNYDGQFCLGSLSRFTQAERRLTNKKQALEDMQNEYELLQKQAFDTYKSNVIYYTLDQTGFIKEAQNWLNMKKENKDADGNKLDGRRGYKEKDIYNYYIKHVEELLGIEGITDISFIGYNWGQATEIEFKYLEHMWRLEVPHIKAIKIKAYEDYGASVFKLKLLHKDSSYCWGWIDSTYEEDDLKDIMQQGIEKHVNNISSAF